MTLETLIVALALTNTAVIGVLLLAGAAARHHATVARRRTAAWREHVDGAIALGDRRPHQDLDRRWP